MADITLLRKLTRKSMLKFGRYHDYTVQQILDTKGIKGLNTLTWYYFCAEAITFFDDILDELGITKEIRIKKPSNITDWRVVNRCCKDAMFNRLKAEDLLDDEELGKLKGMRRKMYFRDKKDNKFRSGVVSKLISNKSILQRKNQGKEMEYKAYKR